MARVPRVDIGGEIYHVINRANARLPIFFKEKDYQLFESILLEAVIKYDMRLLAYCVMPNHFHLVLYPQKDGDLQKFMQWLSLTHTQRWHVQNRTIGSGHLYQGRYKSFLIEKSPHLLTVIRYVERNPLRATLVKNIANWKFSSYYHRQQKLSDTLLTSWPIAVPEDYDTFVQEPFTAGELEATRYSVSKGKPFGKASWSDTMIDKYKLAGTVRERGRPKKGT
jgi:putative transposase